MIVTASEPLTIPIDYHQIKKASLILRALNNKLRQLIIELIYENKRLTVTEILVKLRIEQAVASQHLAILRVAHIVSTEREGKYIFYSINHTKMDEIALFVKNLLGQ